jgi:hypothetical protein
VGPVLRPGVALEGMLAAGAGQRDVVVRLRRHGLVVTHRPILKHSIPSILEFRMNGRERPDQALPTRSAPLSPKLTVTVSSSVPRTTRRVRVWSSPTWSRTS